MLVLEEKDRKKIIIAIIVLIIMIAGTIFFIAFWSMSYGKVSLGRQSGQVIMPEFLVASEEIAITDTTIDPQIFNDPKFKSLTSHVILPIETGALGRTDPFSPPFNLNSFQQYVPVENNMEASSFMPEEPTRP